MKKSVFVFLFLILFLSLGFVSASLFGDFWNRVTGNAIEDISCEVLSDYVSLDRSALQGGEADIDFSFTGNPRRYRIIVGNYDGFRGSTSNQGEGIDELELCGYGPERKDGLELPIDNPSSGRQTFNCVWNDESVFRNAEHNKLVPGDYHVQVILYETPIGVDDNNFVSCTKKIVGIREALDVADEICDNSIDDDLDSKVDCSDSDCASLCDPREGITSCRHSEIININEPIDGSILNYNYDEDLTLEGIQISVEGTSQNSGGLLVAGSRTNINQDGSFRKVVSLTESGENKIIIQSGEESCYVSYYYDKDSFKRYHVSIDDVLLMLYDLDSHEDEYDSIFDQSDFGFLKEMHDKYGTKFSLYLEYESRGDVGGYPYYVPADFDLSKMTDKYKQEFSANSDWLQFQFHTYSVEDRYFSSSYDKAYRDMFLTKREVFRFAGPVWSDFTRTHVWSGTREAAEAWRDLGVKGFLGRGSYDSVAPSHYVLYLATSTPEWLRATNHDYWRDNEEGLFFIQTDLGFEDFAQTLQPNFGFSSITDFLESYTQNSQQSEVMELFTHDFPGSLGRSSIRSQMEESLEWLTNNGYESVFYEEGFLGNDNINVVLPSHDEESGSGDDEFFMSVISQGELELPLGEFIPENTIDGDLSTFWAGDRNKQEWFLTYFLEEPVFVKKVTITFSDRGDEISFIPREIKFASDHYSCEANSVNPCQYLNSVEISENIYTVNVNNNIDSFSIIMDGLSDDFRAPSINEVEFFIEETNTFNTDFTADFTAESLATNIRPAGVHRAGKYVRDPASFMDNIPSEAYYSNLKDIGVEYVDVALFYTYDGALTTGIDAICGFEEGNCDYDFTNLDMIIDNALEDDMKIYLRIAEPKWIIDKYNTYDKNLYPDCERGTNNFANPDFYNDFLPILENIVRHVQERYGEEEIEEWIFSVPVETSIPGAGGFYCGEGRDWELGAENSLLLFSRSAETIKSVNPDLHVNVAEYVNSYYIWYLARHVRDNNRQDALVNIDSLSYHNYPNDFTTGPEGWVSDSVVLKDRIDSVSNDIKESSIFLEESGVDSFIFQGEGNVNADALDERNRNYIGGLFYSLSYLSQVEAGLDQRTHWSDVGRGYGLLADVNEDFSPGEPYPVYYSPYLLHNVVGFYGDVKYKEIVGGDSDLKIYAISANGKDSLIVFNLNENDIVRKEFGVDSSGFKREVTVYRYDEDRTSNSVESLEVVNAEVSGGALYLNYNFEPLSMTIFSFEKESLIGRISNWVSDIFTNN